MTDSVTFPPISAADLDLASQLVASVAWPHRSVDIAFHLRLGQGRIAYSEAEKRTLGFGLWWCYGDVLARLGLIVVAPDAQGRGIGRRLVGHLLDDAGPRSVKLLATEAGRPLYEKLGFKHLDASCQHQGTYAASPPPDPQVRAAGPADLPAIRALDAAAMGHDRTDILDALLGESAAKVVVDAGRVSGYALTRPFGRGTVVGPIVARSEENAIRLFDALARPGFVRVDCPTDATVLRRHLTEHGLIPVDESPSMVRGDWPRPAGPLRIFALASHAFG